jgi:hypothetical protein
MENFFAVRLVFRLPASLSLALVALFAACPLHGQSVTYAGTSSSLNFGSVNVCPSGATTPAPCGKSLTLTYNVTAGGTLGTPKALTLGAPDLDYVLAGGSTCVGLVTEGTTCKVNVTFSPRYAGARNGGVQIVSASGAVLATTLIYGVGDAPQIAFDPGAQTTLAGAPPQAHALTVDELGNVYLVDTIDGLVLKLPADGGAAIPLGAGWGMPTGIEIDGAGNAFVANNFRGFPEAGPYSAVEELPGDGGAQVTLPFTGLGTLGTLSVDGAGDIFLVNEDGVLIDNENTDFFVFELPAGGAQVTLPFQGIRFPYGVAVNYKGDVYVSSASATSRNCYVYKLPPNGGTQGTLPSKGLISPGELAVDAAGDVFVDDEDTHRMLQIPSGGTAPITIGNFPSTGVYPRGVALSSAGDLFVPGTISPLMVIHRSQPPSLSFVQTPVGSTSSDSPQSVQIQNIGNETLALSGLSVSGNFALVPGSGTPADCTAASSLAPGARCNISVSFKPEEGGGPLTGTVTLTDNALNGEPATQSIQLSGGAEAYPPQVQVSATTLRFGDIAYPNGSTLPLTVTNIGGGTLTVAPSINGPSYTISGSTCAGGVAAGANCTLTVQYSPVSVGYHDDILTLATNGGSNPTVSLQALATGVGAIESETPLQFGTVVLGVGSYNVLPLTIYNYGVAGTVTFGTSLNGPSYKVLTTAQNTCLSGIAAGQSCVLPIAFEPVSAGMHGDILTLTPSVGAASSTAHLDGTAVPSF